MKPKATSVPLTVNSPAPVYSYKFDTHSVIDTIPTASTTAMQGETISLMFKPVSEESKPISDSFIKKLQNLVKDLPASVPEASKIDRLAVFGQKPKRKRVPCRDENALNGCLCRVIVDMLIVHPMGYSTQSANKLAVRLSR